MDRKEIHTCIGAIMDHASIIIIIVINDRNIKIIQLKKKSFTK